MIGRLNRDELTVVVLRRVRRSEMDRKEVAKASSEMTRSKCIGTWSDEVDNTSYPSRVATIIEHTLCGSCLALYKFNVLKEHHLLGHTYCIDVSYYANISSSIGDRNIFNARMDIFARYNREVPGPRYWSPRLFQMSMTSPMNPF